MLATLSVIGWTMLCAGVVWLAYVFAGYPLLVWLCSIVRRDRFSATSQDEPMVSVLIAARNEARDIGWKIRETLAWQYPADKLEILVASDASDDGTDDVVRSIADARVRLVSIETRGGKVRALNRLVPMSRGQVLCFTDANARIDRDALRAMVRHFSDPHVACVTGRTVPSTTVPFSAGASIYWDYESIVAGLESRLGAVLVCDGAIHCARASALRPLDPELANDLETPVRVRAAGYLTAFEPRAVALESETQSPGEEYKRRRRICGQGALALWKLRKEISGMMWWQFLSRKVLRWLISIPLFLVLGGSALLVREPFFAALLAVQLGFYGMALAAHVSSGAAALAGRWASLPFYFVLGALGAFRGVLDTAAGRRYAVWDVAALSRGRG